MTILTEQSESEPDQTPLGHPVDVAAFPSDFVFGAATAAYQIEGAAKEGGRGPSIWDTFSHQPGRTANGETGDVACDHYHRWREDIDILDTLGLNGYRMSVSWSRLQPQGYGPLNPEGVAYYRAVLEALKDKGIEPLVTLYHWDLPQPLEDAGGWPERITAVRFAQYAARTVEALGDLATNWVTLNEPWCSAFLGYGTGAHAPGRRELGDAIRAAHHLNLAHGLAVRAIRKIQVRARIGIALLLTDLHPATDSHDDIAATERMDINQNLMFLEPVLGQGYSARTRELYGAAGLETAAEAGDGAIVGARIDFLGVNHYHQNQVRYQPGAGHLEAALVAAQPATTTLGWSVRPDALARTLRRVASMTDLPLYVTESGACFPDQPDDTGAVEDPERIDYLSTYLAAAADLCRGGVNLRGFYVWSLLDNYEWAEGYAPRFGLVHVDYVTQTRTPKASAAWYRALIASHTRTVGARRSVEANHMEPNTTGKRWQP
jgi:beta-glucosidase